MGIGLLLNPCYYLKFVSKLFCHKINKLYIFFTSLSFQICVLHSVNQGPIAAEYSVSGTTYAPEGFIFDSTGIQVIYLQNMPFAINFGPHTKTTGDHIKLRCFIYIYIYKIHASVT